MKNNENKELCKKCDGKCCKKSGCDYSADDLKKVTKDYIVQLLEEGNTSIVAYFDIRIINGKPKFLPTLYLRARNKGRGEIDLFSLKRTCSLLTKKGCPYSFYERPTGGKNLVPHENGCYQLQDPKTILNSWIPYQSILYSIVKMKTGKSVEEKIKEDVVNLFVDLKMENFDDVMINEIFDILSISKYLQMAYPDELIKAVKITNNFPIARNNNQQEKDVKDVNYVEEKPNDAKVKVKEHHNKK